VTPRRLARARTLINLLAGILLPAIAAAGAEVPVHSTSDQPPRKVIVGTVLQPFWGKHPGLDKRLAQVIGIIDRMQAQSEKKYGRGLDLAVLPEVALTGQGEDVGSVAQWSYPLKGLVEDTFAQEARKCHCYIVATTYLQEAGPKKEYSNAAIVFDRTGKVVGIYRKVQLVCDMKTGSMEHGCTPGKDVPVFQCDFGRLGIQICYDMDFDYGWGELARKGAELVVWPSQSPQTSQPACRARHNHYYIISSTWHNNASVFEPTGKIVSQVTWAMNDDLVKKGIVQPPDNNILVQELDLAYAILPYSRKLHRGLALQEKYGDKVGFRYYEDEECGMFWSNDPHMTIRQMYQSIGLEEADKEYQRAAEFFHKAGVVGY
jgi:predicted amidohydrolase